MYQLSMSVAADMSVSAVHQCIAVSARYWCSSWHECDSWLECISCTISVLIYQLDIDVSAEHECSENVWTYQSKMRFTAAWRYLHTRCWCFSWTVYVVVVTCHDLVLRYQIVYWLQLCSIHEVEESDSMYESTSVFLSSLSQCWFHW